MIIAEIPKFIEALREGTEKLKTAVKGGAPENEDIGLLYAKLQILHKACEEREKQTDKPTHIS